MCNGKQSSVPYQPLNVKIKILGSAFTLAKGLLRVIMWTIVGKEEITLNTLHLPDLNLSSLTLSLI